MGKTFSIQDSISGDAVHHARQAVAAVPDDLGLASFQHQLVLLCVILLLRVCTSPQVSNRLRHGNACCVLDSTSGKYKSCTRPCTLTIVDLALSLLWWSELLPKQLVSDVITYL